MYDTRWLLDSSKIIFSKQILHCMIMSCYSYIHHVTCNELFHKIFISSESKSCKNSWCFYYKVMIRSGHNFAHVTTAELSWHVQIYGLIGWLELQPKQIEFSQDFNYELLCPVWNGALVSPSGQKSQQRNNKRYASRDDFFCDLPVPGTKLLKENRVEW